MSINIVNQLIPNVFTLIAQLLSTFVLFLLMRKFLWKSIQAYLQKRSDKLQSDLLAGESAKAQAESDRELAKKQLERASLKSQEMVEKATVQAKQERQLILDQAQQEAKIREDRASEQIAKERRDLENTIKAEIVNVALSATAKVVGEKHATDIDEEAITQFVEGNSHE
ncbi:MULTISPECIES: ATP synthase F0 subunit B [Terrabacteria group]|uniref:ATP synthase F0 subunit B n=1 Tax=Bacillati TaxID=1783272 RepID=UPI00193AA68A|nr:MULTISPECIES: ATP synthase F0 subunit B [Terrabacteria group]MBW9212482.1 ATP synthase F0 subunit B [Trueperella sp. zg.1013]QRG86762.1 ATP synthase F0 subunit B [Bulleidia sp. zg-1006]